MEQRTSEYMADTVRKPSGRFAIQPFFRESSNFRPVYWVLATARFQLT
jgi:hypothetical protein